MKESATSRRIFRRCRAISILAAAGAAFLLSLGAAGGTTTHELDALERDYWRCDYATTTGMLDPGEAVECSMITERFMKAKFGGDFKQLHAWWLQHKAVRHQAARVEERERAGLGVPADMR